MSRIEAIKSIEQLKSVRGLKPEIKRAIAQQLLLKVKPEPRAMYLLG